MTRSRLSNKMESLSESRCLVAKRKVLERKARGLPVYDYGLGEARGAVPALLKRAAVKSIEDEHTGYIEAGGLPELRSAVVEWLGLEDHYCADNVLISVGAKQALFNIFLAVCDPGDAVLLDSTHWVSYAPMIHACSSTPISLSPEAGAANYLKISPKDVEQALALNSNVRALLINSPNNPTGQVYSQEEIDAFVDICSSHKIFLILDRIYWKTLFISGDYPEPVITPENKPWIIQVDAISKSWRSLGGLRVGWTVGPEDLTDVMVKMQSHLTSGTATPGQYAALAGIQAPYDPEMQTDLTNKKELFYNLACELPLVTPFPTQGGFYSFWDIHNVFGKKTTDGTVLHGSDDVCEYLINEAGVVTIPGTAFDIEGYLRTCFGVDTEQIEQGMVAAADALRKLS